MFVFPDGRDIGMVHATMHGPVRLGYVPGEVIWSDLRVVPVDHVKSKVRVCHATRRCDQRYALDFCPHHSTTFSVTVRRITPCGSGFLAASRSASVSSA